MGQCDGFVADVGIDIFFLFKVLFFVSCKGILAMEEVKNEKLAACFANLFNLVSLTCSSTLSSNG